MPAAFRACAAADRTGHAILHTLYQQCLKHKARFFVEYFAIDLIMDDDGRCRGVIALNLDDGTKEFMMIASAEIAAVAKTLASKRPPTADFDRFIAAVDTLQQAKYLFCDSAIIGAEDNNRAKRAKTSIDEKATK